MGRLIRDTDIMAEISEWRTDAFIDDNTPAYDMLCKVEGLINDADEAYSVEAVVRELEKEYEATIDLYHRTADAYYSGKAYGLDIAIEIVRGGRND